MGNDRVEIGLDHCPVQLGTHFEKLNEYNVAGPLFIQQAGITALKKERLLS